MVHAETGTVQELCEIARDTPPALLTLPSGDVLLSRDATSRFLGARPQWRPMSKHTDSLWRESSTAHGNWGMGQACCARGIGKTVKSDDLMEHMVWHRFTRIAHDVPSKPTWVSQLGART